MGENSEIQWTHHTFSPWEGCAKISEGCRNCYAEVRNARFHPRSLPTADDHGVMRGEHWGLNAPRLARSESYWRQPLAWNKRASALGERHRVFCASVADVFEGRDDLDVYRARLWPLIEATPSLDWMLLTKRPENAHRMVPTKWRDREWPNNVWFGTTTESRETLNERWPWLIGTPARVRFLSCEPLLEDIAFDLEYLMRRGIGRGAQLVIVGGESGPSARPYECDWARCIIHVCREQRVACFHKQLGEHAVDDQALYPEWCHVGARLENIPGGDLMRVFPTTKKGGEPSEWLEELRVREMPR